MLNDVVVYGVEGLAQWGEQLFGQASKEQPPDQGDVAGAAATIARRPSGVNLISVARRSWLARLH